MSEHKFIETVKHSFVTRDSDEAEFTAIRIDEGKFKNVIYAYNEIQVGEEEREDGGLDLNFTILEIKSDNDNHKIHEQEFHKVVGDFKLAGNPIKMSSYKDEKTRGDIPDLDEHRQKIIKEFCN